MLNRELRALEKKSVASGNFVGLINETLQSYKDNSFDQMFHGNRIYLQDLLPCTLNALTSIFYPRHVEDQESRMKSYLDTAIYEIR